MNSSIAPPVVPASATPAADRSAKPDGSPRSWSWIPIRSLAPRHRPRIAAHLLSLDARDRYLRFGYAASDAQISKYVDLLDFDQDEVFGIFNRRLELIALAHLAHPHDAQDGTASMSEFGVSVLPRARGRGFGRRLFEHAMLHARNRGIDTLFIHALSENTAMLKIAKAAGATVEQLGPEAEAYLKLPPDTFASHLDELMERQAAEIDYRLKQHARVVSDALGAIAEVKQSIGRTSHIAED